MFFKSNSVQVRMVPLCREEFAPEVYRPGVISLSRLVWGSFGGGLLLAIIAFLSRQTGVEVLFPPLAATCFINSTCVFLRVARPKPVIVGHFVASIGGLAGVWAGSHLGAGTEYAVACKLGLAVLFAAILMQIFDADHPPAAATAAIPAILPLPMPAYLLPVNMAWGATLAVLFALIWNRLWFEFPAKDVDYREKRLGLYMDTPQVGGMAICMLGFLLMCFQQASSVVHALGMMTMLLGVALLGAHHLFAVVRSA
ncbi:HPP family protein [Salidesulfovibrio brasiliensis]|uniref:HPP family protein n=1 Tax=Salidesulfovibrio brasiliensis TaxID=221711 RepID=UPI0006D0BA35